MEKTVIVVWNQLDFLEKTLIVGLFNNRAFHVPHSAAGMRVYCHCNIWHDADGYDVEGNQIDRETGGVWDACIEITETGGLRISGASGPSGQQPYVGFILPEDTKIEIGAYVG